MQGWRDIYQVIDIIDIYLISIKQDFNIDFLFCVEDQSKDKVA